MSVRMCLGDWLDEHMPNSVYRALGRLYRAKWWLLHRLHPRHRYHVIDTGLPPNYYDEDTLILHACMAMLGRYIKWHGGPDSLEAFSAELRTDEYRFVRQADQQDEAVAIWRWWTIEHPADRKRREEMLNELYGARPPRDDVWHARNDEFRALEAKIDADEQSMLHRLIDIRPGLWT